MEVSKKNIAQYTLRSKDVPLISFSLYELEEEAFGLKNKVYSVQIDKIFLENQALFPKNLSINPSNDELLRWINRRKAPKNRQFVEKILAAFDDSTNPMRYVDISRALSLNDAYWIVNNLVACKWDDCNLYAHPFDEILSYVAFTGYSEKVSGVVTSPELTSSGALKKCWSNRADGIYLIKGDDFFPRADGRSQATNEYYAAQVAAAMGIEHIDYDLEEFKHRNGQKEIVCKCKLFTSNDEGFVESASFYKEHGIDLDNVDVTSLVVQRQLADLFGQEKYADMMLFDSVIANKDRHFGNFGMLVDNNTGAYLRPAPIFDNGYSLFYSAAASDLTKDNWQNYVQTLHCKYFSLDMQAQIFVAKRHLPALRRLLNFKFTKHPQYNIADSTLEIMSKFIQQRAARSIELYYKKMNNR